MPWEAAVGTELGGFLIKGVIGRGGMATVYLAEQTALGRTVALKVLSSELAEESEFRRRFIKESRLAAGLDHPNIVPVYDAGEAEGLLYLAMRLIDGVDLKRLLERAVTLPTHRAIGILSQIASALDAAHAKGLIHRDVKPANILVERLASDGGDRAYLADFGLARSVLASSAHTQPGTVFGTLDYMAPEQVEDKPTSGATDVYALGCVLHECLVGSAPFHRETIGATLIAHLNEEPPPASRLREDLPPELDRVLARALAKEKVDRYQTSGAFVTEAAHLIDEVDPADSRELDRAGRAAASRPGEPRGTRASPERDASQPRGAKVNRRIGKFALVVAGLAFAVLAAVVGIIALDRTPDANPDGLSGARPLVNSLLRIDPETGETEQVAGGLVSRTDKDWTSSLDVGEGGVWYIDEQLRHVDPVTGREEAAHLLAGAYNSVVAVGKREVWVVTSAELLRLDPADDDVIGRTRLSFMPGAGYGPTALAFDDQSGWISWEDGFVYRVGFDGKLQSSVQVGELTSDVIVAAGQVWVTDPFAGELIQVDPSTQRVSDRIDLGGSPAALASSGDDIWVMDQAGIVTAVDLHTHKLGVTIRVGERPVDIAAGVGSVWIADVEDGTLREIGGLEQRVVTTFRVGVPIGTLAVDERTGLIWVRTTRTGHKQ